MYVDLQLLQVAMFVRIFLSPDTKLAARVALTWAKTMTTRHNRNISLVASFKAALQSMNDNDKY